MYKTIIDQLVLIYSKKPYEGFYLEQKQKYFSKVGKIFNDDPMFEIHMNGFIEWYLFKCRLLDYCITPLMLHYFKNEDVLSSQEKSLMLALKHSVRSVFEVMDKQREQVKLRDLFDGFVYENVNLSTAVGIEKRDYIDALVFKHENQNHMTDSISIYPSVARELIKSSIDRRNSNEHDLDLILGFAFKKWKKEKYPNLSWEQIFTEDQGMHHAA